MRLAPKKHAKGARERSPEQSNASRHVLGRIRTVGKVAYSLDSFYVKSRTKSGSPALTGKAVTREKLVFEQPQMFDYGQIWNDSLSIAESEAFRLNRVSLRAECKHSRFDLESH